MGVSTGAERFLSAQDIDKVRSRRTDGRAININGGLWRRWRLKDRTGLGGKGEYTDTVRAVVVGPQGGPTIALSCQPRQ